MLLQKVSYYFFFFLLFFSLLFSSFGLAISLTPSSFETEYELGAIKEFTFFANGCPCLLSLGGDLANSSTIVGENVLMEAGYFKAALILPELSPGEHTLLVKNSENPPEKKYGQPTGVSALASVAAKVKINIPYPGKYLEASLLEVSRINQAGQSVYFSINLISRGKEQINKITGLIDIYDEGENKTKIVAVPVTEINNFPGLGSGTLYGEWITPQSTPPGLYRAEAVINYDGVELKQSRSFLLGTPKLEITSIFPQELPSKEISALALGIKSVWNNNINFYVQLLTKDENGQILKETKSQNFDISPWTNLQANVFFDPSDLLEKEYTLEVILHYLDQETKKEFKIKLIPSLPKPKVAEPQQPQGNLSPILIVIIIALIAVICGLIFKYYQKKEEEW